MSETSAQRAFVLMAVPASDTSYDYRALWTDRSPRIYFDRASNNARQILSGLQAEVMDSGSDADLLWIRKGPRDWYDKLGPFQAINHIPLERSMIRKGDLAQNLRRYGVSQPQASFSHADFLPTTYCLYDPEERAAFIRQLPQVDYPDNLWMLKPSNLSKGEGIKILWKFDWLRGAAQKRADIRFRYEGRIVEYLAQRYLKNVLLVDGKKSQIRIYWLIASLDPLLVLMYPEGTLRFALQPYKLEDFNNPLIHLTNDYQQKKHGDYRPDAVPKWSFQQWQEYLVREKGVSGNYFEDELRPRLRQILSYIVRANLEHLRKTPASGHFFGVYAADLLLDDKLMPWVTEIQKDPGLGFRDPLQRRLKPPMLGGAVNIVLDVLALKRKGRPLAELQETYGYEWVIR